MNRKAGHRTKGILGRKVLAGAFLVVAGMAAGCEEVDLTVPNADEVEAAYIYGGGLTATVSGNVAEVTIVLVTNLVQQARRPLLGLTDPARVRISPDQLAAQQRRVRAHRCGS